jgi:hypothetical protein
MPAVKPRFRCTIWNARGLIEWFDLHCILLVLPGVDAGVVRLGRCNRWMQGGGRCVVLSTREPINPRFLRSLVHYLLYLLLYLLYIALCTWLDNLFPMKMLLHDLWPSPLSCVRYGCRRVRYAGILTPANLHFCLIVKAIDPSCLHAGCLWQDQ